MSARALCFRAVRLWTEYPGTRFNTHTRQVPGTFKSCANFKIMNIHAMSCINSTVRKSAMVFVTVKCVAWCLSGRALDLRFTGCGFNSRPVAFT